MGSIITKRRYFDKYLKMILAPKNRERNGEAIWKDLEEWHFLKTGENKYKTYGTFRKEKSIFHANNR